MRPAYRVVRGSRAYGGVLRKRHQRLGHGVPRIGGEGRERTGDIGCGGPWRPHALQEQIAQGKVFLVHVVKIAARRQVRRMAPDVSGIERQIVPELTLDTERPTKNLRQARCAREQPVYALVVLEIRDQLGRPIVVLRKAACAQL